MRKYIATLFLATGLALSIPAIAGASEFKDVSPSHEYYKEIVNIKDKEIIKGFADNTFKPNNPLKRSQVVLIMGRYFNIEDPNSATLKFKDVKKTDEYYNFLGEFVNRGVFVNVEKFNPNSYLTEAQLAKIMVEGFQLKGSNNLSLNGVPKNHWSYSYISILVDNGIIKYEDVPKLSLNQNATRGTVAAYMSRILDLSLKKEVGTFGVELLSPSSIEHFISKSTKNKVEPTYSFNTEADFNKAVSEVYDTLPSKAKLSTTYSISEVKKFLYNWEQNNHPKDSINNMTLATYSVKRIGGSLYLVDSSHPTYTAKQIESGLKAFSKDFSKQIEDMTEFDKINVIYNYIFDNFKYNANSTTQMYVGNAYTGQFACNGYSRMFYELANAAGIDTEIRRGESHFWNTVTLSNGEVITVDITTDDYLKKVFFTLGSDSQSHIDKTGLINFYSAKFDTAIYPKIEDTTAKTDLALKVFVRD